MQLRGVRVHNLQGIDLDLPLRKFVVVCGVSGSGKSSLAFDTLYAEGQRRYIESFSTYDRQFLERLDRPDADRIDQIPPAVAVRQRREVASRRLTVATLTEIHDYLRLLYSRLGTVRCPKCGREVRRETPRAIREVLGRLPKGTRFQVAFSVPGPPLEELEEWRSGWRQRGFTRVVVGNRTHSLDDLTAATLSRGGEVLVVVDRLSSGGDDGRLTDSVETALQQGDGACVLLIAAPLPDSFASREWMPEIRAVDERDWHVWNCQTRLVCGGCGQELMVPEPRLFSFSSPLGACPTCRGLGVGSGGEPCPACQGTRLRPEANAVFVAGLSLPEFCRFTVSQALDQCQILTGQFQEAERPLSASVLPQIVGRLESLQQVGLEYLTLDRAAASLSGGEARRVSLVRALGSQLVNTLFVFDEPTAGLHAANTEQLLQVLLRLRDAGNSLVVVEHDPRVLQGADWLVELGPGAGREGGRLLYQGEPAGLAHCEASVTREWLANGKGAGGGSASTADRRGQSTGSVGALKLSGVAHRNLRDVSVEFPLGCLCCVSGVSGSGKSSLVLETLYPALCGVLGKPVPGVAGTYAKLSGVEAIADLVLVDALLPARSSRSNPATLLGVFGQIRTLFAETADAKVLNFTEKQFGFNAREGSGRCPTCNGLGTLAVDLQFLPDVSMTCPECGGRRFRREILAVKYRGLDIAEVLDLTARDAFAFFRGIGRVQRRLQWLRDVGLDYLPLGQPLDTLSGGELQRLKLAAASSGRSKGRTLFVLDEPTTGLHPADVQKLLTSWRNLVDAGHSLIVVEHNLEVLRAADWVIDLGPGAGEAGGRVVAEGLPQKIAASKDSVTGKFLQRR